MRTLVVYGNCQAGAIAATLQCLPEVAELFEVHHHFVSPSDADFASWADHIERLEAIVIQNIGDWIHYPFREKLPPSAAKIDIPFVYLGSLWPFDCTQNPNDTVAQQLRPQYPDWDFAYHDSVLARLRTEIPDPAARFQAYAKMEFSNKINIKRYHALELMRLQRVDKKLGLHIGEFIIDNFRKQQLFYSITHPTPALMRHLVEQILNNLKVSYNANNLIVTDAFSYYQVPLHPRVIDDLRIEWANPQTLYRFYDRVLTFNEYFQKYIEIYG